MIRAISIAVVAVVLTARAADRRSDGVERTTLLPPGANNPRNSEGDFITLADGRILFIYTHFTGGAGDHAAAHLASRVSSDGGKTWSDRDEVVLKNEGGWNVMSVSLLRLADGRIGLFYLRKNSTEDCRPLVRFSTDEAKTWSEPTTIIGDEQLDYYVLNNDRVIQLTGDAHKGRILVPVARHTYAERREGAGRICVYFSDDGAKSWRRSESLMSEDAAGKRINFQEPGIVELKDGRLLMFIRTREGSQFLSYSKDGGSTWTAPAASEILSPLSPASIERIPSTGDLLMVWNDHRDIKPELKGKRTPLTVAISKDEGATWEKRKVLEDDPNGWYCYTAVHFVGEHVLLGHCAGDQSKRAGLNTTQITRFGVKWLYE